MQRYYVSSTWDADADTLCHYLYIRNVLMNPQAADAFLTKYDKARKLLSKSAGPLRIGSSCDLSFESPMDSVLVYILDSEEEKPFNHSFAICLKTGKRLLVGYEMLMKSTFRIIT